MRHHVRTHTKGGARALALCLVAVFAFAAFGAAGASAASMKQPEWGGCVSAPGHEGKYGDASCTEPVKKVDGRYTGAYEWYPFAKYLELTEEGAYSFEGGEIAPTTFETTTGKRIECATGELQYTGILTGHTVGEVLPVFHGCQAEGQPCASKFQNEGEISDEIQWLEGEGLKGELVYLSGRNTLTPAVGLTLTSFNAGAPLFTVVCDGPLGTVEIGGAGGKKAEKPKGNAAISVVGPVDRMTTEFTQTFAQTAGVQEPAKAEKGKEKTLEMYLGNEDKWVQLGLASTFTAISESGRPPIEIRAVQ